MRSLNIHVINLKIMRKQFIIIMAAAMSYCCSAQVVRIENQTGEYSAGTYYKDTNNLLNPFAGTYEYSGNGLEITIKLRKVTMSNRADYFTEDLIVGEYRVIEGGVERVNTLSLFDTDYSNQIEHSIDGNQILTAQERGCTDCLQGEIRLSGGLTENLTGNFALVIFRLLIENGQPALKVSVNWQQRSYRVDTQSPPPLPTFPSGDYLFIKQ